MIFFSFLLFSLKFWRFMFRTQNRIQINKLNAQLTKHNYNTNRRPRRNRLRNILQFTTMWKEKNEWTEKTAFLFYASSMPFKWYILYFICAQHIRLSLSTVIYFVTGLLWFNHFRHFVKSVYVWYVYVIHAVIVSDVHTCEWCAKTNAWGNSSSPFRMESATENMSLRTRQKMVYSQLGQWT